MPALAKIAFLDEDHVMRAGRYAISGPGEITQHWMRDFFLPEDCEPAAVYAVGHGLHASDGFEVLGPAAAHNAEGGTDAHILVFRRGTITRDFIAASPNLKFVLRLGARADGIDLAAAADRGVVVSCLPRPSLIYTAEHAILLMLALSKRLVEADAAVRAGRWDRGRVRPTDGVAYNWAGLTNLSGLHGKTLGIIGLGEVGALLAPMARGMGMQVIYTNRRPMSAEQELRLAAEYRPLERLLAAADFVSVNAANLPENRGLIGAATFAANRPDGGLRVTLMVPDARNTGPADAAIVAAGAHDRVEASRNRPSGMFAVEISRLNQ